jgi:hypothetical protein
LSARAVFIATANIINQLKYPEEGFEDVIKEHFRLKKTKIIEYLRDLKKDNELKLFESLV